MKPLMKIAFKSVLVFLALTALVNLFVYLWPEMGPASSALGVLAGMYLKDDVYNLVSKMKGLK